MARKGRTGVEKRSSTPKFWGIPRKTGRFAVGLSPGPHSKGGSYPLTILVRDIMKLVKNYREARFAIRHGKFLIDNVIRKEPNFPVGPMDIVRIPSLGKSFRLVPSPRGRLMPIEIPEEEANQKFCKVRSKITVKGGKVQYGLHDGRNILATNEVDLHPGDTCLIEVPSQKLVRQLRFEKGALALVTRGRKAGELGKITDVKPTTISRKAVATVSLSSGESEIPANMLLVVGKDTPMLAIQRM